MLFSNNASFLVIVVFVLGVSFAVLYGNVAHADIIPPKKQINIGISPDDVVCEDGMFKVVRAATDTVACVKTNNVLKLVSNGWAKPVDEKTLGVKLNQTSVPLGKINKLYVEPVKTLFGKLTPKSPAAGYDFAFEVCASGQKIYVPDILIKSDSETQRYEIPDNIEPNTCLLSVTFIKAADPNSIQATLLNKGDISKTLSEMEAKISSIQEELAIARKSIGDKSSPDTAQGSKIIELRKQLNDAKEDLYRLFFTLHAVQKEKYHVQKMSFTGVPIEGEAVSLITVKKTISDENMYDVVFEACAGKTQIRIPIITISSDMDTVTVKLGDKIAPNTCQMTSAKISSSDPATITVAPTGNAESNNKVVQIENQISNLQKEINSERELLRSLLHNPDRPSDFTEQVEMHSTNIIKLREGINSLKAELNKILYQVYQ